MTFDVAYIPADVPAKTDAVCVVVDVLRASSAIVNMFDMGCREVRLTDAIDAFFARRDAAGDAENMLVCAENVAGTCLDGADFSPSLAAMEGMDAIAGRCVLMQTTNGTEAVHTLLRRGRETVLVGCLRNATAVMEKAVELAQKAGAGIHIVCAGREVGTSYTIDDVYCAAHLVACGEKAARAQNAACTLNDSARLAKMTLTQYEDPRQAFADSASGEVMRRIGCMEDVRLCAIDDVSVSVPAYAGQAEDGSLRLVRL